MWDQRSTSLSKTWNVKEETVNLSHHKGCKKKKNNLQPLSNCFLTCQRSSLRRGDGSSVHTSKKSRLWGVGRDVLVLPLMPPSACAYGRAPVGGLGLLGGSEVVEASAIWAGADGAIQAHGALAVLLGLALACPHVQTWDKGIEKLGCYHENANDLWDNLTKTLLAVSNLYRIFLACSSPKVSCDIVLLALTHRIKARSCINDHIFTLSKN